MPDKETAYMCAGAADLLAFIRRWHDIIIGKRWRRYSRPAKPGDLEPWARAFDDEEKALIATLTKLPNPASIERKPTR